MLDQLTEIFCEVDDFCKVFLRYLRRFSLPYGSKHWKRGPECRLSLSEIMTIMIVFQGSRYKDFKSFYLNVVQTMLKPYFPHLVTYERFVELQGRALVPLMFLLVKRMGRKTGKYYVDSTILPVCNLLRMKRNKVFYGLAACGKTRAGCFFGFKLHLVINHQNELMGIKFTKGNVQDITVLDSLTQGLTGKIFGDKGYLSAKIKETLEKRGLNLFTRVRKNMKPQIIKEEDKKILNKRSIIETIIGKVKDFSSFNLARCRKPLHGFAQIIAALINYQFNPIKPKIHPKLCNI